MGVQVSIEVHAPVEAWPVVDQLKRGRSLAFYDDNRLVLKAMVGDVPVAVAADAHSNVDGDVPALPTYGSCAPIFPGFFQHFRLYEVVVASHACSSMYMP